MGGKYNDYSSNKRQSTRDKESIHPIWRGVGFAMIVLIPIISYAGSVVLIQQNSIHGWLPLPTDILARPGEFLYSLIPDQLLYIKIMLMVALMFLFYLIFLLISSMMTSMFGFNSRNDPFYVPPPTRTNRRRR